MVSDASAETILKFRDTHGHYYICPDKDDIGKGGQGRVLRVKKDSNIAIKIACHKDGSPVRDTNQIKEYQRKMTYIRHLPLPPSLRLSMPIAILDDTPGYVMRLLSDMSPLGRLIGSNLTEPQLNELVPELPDWIKRQVKDERGAQLLMFYATTGGLRRRLELLLQVASTFARLHACGLVFGDLSPNNVQIGSGKQGQAWLIDIDNLCFDGEGAFFLTRGYCAPEVRCAEKGCSRYSDSYAFALLAFELLTMNHAFRSGNMVDKNINKEEAADRGEVPWIYDPDDKANFYQNPVHPYFLTLPLFELFQLTFTKGKKDRRYRPQLWMWHTALAWSLDRTVQCPHCGMSLVREEHTDSSCPFCEHTLPPIIEGTVNGNLIFAHENINGEFFIPRRVFCPCSLEYDAPLLCWKKSENEIILSVSDEKARLHYCISEEKTIQGTLRLPLKTIVSGFDVWLDMPSSWKIHFQERKL